MIKNIIESKWLLWIAIILMIAAIYIFVMNKSNSSQNSKINPDEFSSVYNPSIELTIKGPEFENGFKVAKVDTDQSREKGLMNIKHMNVENGLLFEFQNTEVVTFWMKNTYIPLDMIFIDQDKKVVNIAKNAQILSESPTYSSSSPVKYVLEINAFLSDRLNIAVGDTVDWK